MNPHEILGVPPDASEEDIKRAYKRMAMEWHPDRHGGDKEAEEKFKEINAAYQILTGRARNPVEPAFRPDATDEEVFEFFRNGGGFPFDNIFAPHMRGARSRAGLSMAVSMEEAYAGARRTIRYARRDPCPGCGGHGREIGEESCPACGGLGRMAAPTTSAVFTIMLTCQACGGLGKRLGNACPKCRGARTVSVQRETTVDLPSGIADGEQVAAADGSRVTVRYQPHPFLSMVPGTLNTQSDADVGVFDLMLGGETPVRTLAGEMRVKIDPGLRPGSRLRIKGAGMVGRSGAKGDHVVRIWARMPELTEDHRKALGELRAEIEGEHK